MKTIHKKAILSTVFAVLMMICCLPVSVFAATENSFILVVEADGKLVIAPEYVNSTADTTIAEALVNSGHDFLGIGDGNIYEINGVDGSFRRSDEDNDYDLSKTVSEVDFYRFTEEEDYYVSAGLQKLMTAMADYLLEEKDVQLAAKSVYDTAYSQFVGIDSFSATVLAEELTAAIKEYKDIQNGQKYTVTFKNNGQTCSKALITVENQYGKVWTEENSDGKLQLPAGEYIFCVEKDGVSVKGNVKVTADTAVNTSLKETPWLKTETFRISGSYNAISEEDGLFTDNEFDVQWDGRNATVAVMDVFTGTVYSYIEYDDKATGNELPEVYAVYQSNGKQVSEKIFLESYRSGATSALKRGATGNTIVYKASLKGTDGYTYYQDYTVNLERVPTLKGISVSDITETGKDPVDQAATEPFSAGKMEYTYKVLDDVSKVKIEATPYQSGYTVKINGTQINDGAEIAVKNDTTVKIEVSYGDYKSTYILTIKPGAGQKIVFKTASADIKLTVTNKNNMVMPYKYYKGTDNGNYYQYTLVTEDEYCYVATKNDYFYMTDSFKLEDFINQTVNVSVPTDSWLKELAFGNSDIYKSKGTLALDKTFVSSEHSYIIETSDTEHKIYVWCDANQAGVKIEAIYNQLHTTDTYHKKDNVVEINDEAEKGKLLNRLMIDEHPQGNNLTIRLSKENDGVTYYQDYVVDVNRKLSVGNITAKCDGNTATLVKKDGSSGFSIKDKEYDITVPMASRHLVLSVTKYNSTSLDEDENSYRITVDGKNITTAGLADIALDGTIKTQTVKVMVESDQAPGGTTEYVLNILKSPPVYTTFNLSPENAVINLIENRSEERIWPDENGSYQLCEGFSYNYTVSKYEYISIAGTLTVTRDGNNALVVTDSRTDATYTVQEDSSGGVVTIGWSLNKATVNTNIKTDIKSEWSDFRGNDIKNGDYDNNAITDAPITYKSDKSTLYWANKLGSGIDSGAVGSPIIVNGDIITYASTTLFRINAVTGEVLARGKMVGSSSFAITPPTYAEGMIFVALSDGRIQAFNADTLESLWVFTDAMGGQPNCPLTYKDGYLYTGFWIGERDMANFVCVSVTDEDPSYDKEMKRATWTYASKGGYYWAGAYAGDGYVMVGTDDGESLYYSQTSKLLLLDAETGRFMDSWNNLDADIRSTVVYDEVTKAHYFTAKGGTFYSVKVENGKLTDKKSLVLSNDSATDPMSTCSPVVYNKRAYVGVSGTSQFGDYSGHNITVIDLEKWEIAYKVKTQGYPQTSGLLTTAYEETTGNVYIYYFDNASPGKLRVISDKAGQKTPNYITTEEGYSTAYALFTPVGAQKQYAICSPIVDEYGTIYFKNDSAHLMAFGSAVEKIEITSKPTKLKYAEGEKFDPTGMQVTAVYANGKTRDVTKYVSYNTNELTKADEMFTITFEHVMYHNQENGTEMQAGVTTTTPTATLQINVISETLGDVNNDGNIDKADAQMILDYEAQNISNEISVEKGDVSGDGIVDSNDAVLIAQYIAGKITEFPVTTTEEQ